MYCDLVKETLWIVADDQDAARLVRQGEKRGTVYSAAEVRAIVTVRDPALVREIHHFKRVFDRGRLSAQNESTTSRQNTHETLRGT